MIYVHVPFCRSFCTYCDFYSEILARTGRGCKDAAAGADGFPLGGAGSVVQRYADEICREIRERREEIRATLGLNTLYIGGGTPSVLPLPVLRRIVDALSEVSGVPIGTAGADGAASGVGPAGRYKEFTIEVNPEDIVERGPEFVQGLLNLGVTRISMGVQSLDDSILRWMNRRHDAARARRAWQILRDATQVFPPSAFSGREEHSPVCSLSVDLIIGVPGMTEGILSETLKEIIFEWRPDHVSAYQLSIEEGSTLAERIAAGKEEELPEEQCRAQYEMVCRVLTDAGYEHYEISNWALPGRRSIHNSAYWTRQPYVGLGPGAHSLSCREATATANISPSAESSGALPLICPGTAEAILPYGSGKSGYAAGRQQRSWNSRALSGWMREGEVLSPEEIREEQIMLGLRTADGIAPDILTRGNKGLSAEPLADGAEGPGSRAGLRTGRQLPATRAEAGSGQLPAGLAWNGGRIRIPESEWFVADEIIAGII